MSTSTAPGRRPVSVSAAGYGQASGCPPVVELVNTAKLHGIKCLQNRPVRKERNSPGEGIFAPPSGASRESLAAVRSQLPATGCRLPAAFLLSSLSTPPKVMESNACTTVLSEKHAFSATGNRLKATGYRLPTPGSPLPAPGSSFVHANAALVHTIPASRSGNMSFTSTNAALVHMNDLPSFQSSSSFASTNAAFDTTNAAFLITTQLPCSQSQVLLSSLSTKVRRLESNASKTVPPGGIHGQSRYYDGMLYLMSLRHASGEFRIITPRR